VSAIARVGDAVVAERARIARELHDVVAHAISVVLLQARGGRKAVPERPDDAVAAFGAIEETASHALVEMRRLLEVLRADDGHAELAPQPGLAELESLAAKVRAAGLAVELRVEGARASLPRGLDLSAYRIVQEALTNALKHARAAKARVTVRYAPDALALEIADDGIGVGSGDGAGHGLAGMRERVAVFGGELEAGPEPQGGFAVRARLPL
jgi:signal transduction histidine kinase